MADSLVIGEVIELLGGGVPTSHPLCPGAVFRLGPAFDLSGPQLTQAVASLLLGGGVPVSGHVDNRHPVLPVVILVPPTGNPVADQQTLAGAREALAEAVAAPRWTMSWTRDGSAGPMLFDCFAATSVVRAYSIIRDKDLLSEVDVAFDALPYGKSDVAEIIPFNAPSTGWAAPALPVTVDAYSTVASTVNPAQWSQSSQGAMSATSARWSRQSSGFPDYARTITPLDFTGRKKLSLWVGLGTSTYSTWHAGTLTGQIILTDGSGATVTVTVRSPALASALPAAPRWQKLSGLIPATSAFDLTTVSAYEIKLWNRVTAAGPNLQAECYLDTFTAAAASAGTPGTRGAVYSLPGVAGTAPAPLTIQLAPGPSALPQTALFTATGSNNWTAPAGVTSVQQVEVVAGGGGGRAAGGLGGGGGGGGEHVFDVNVPVTPATVYHPTVGASGLPGAPVPTDGGDSFFTGDAGRTVRAHGGKAAGTVSNVGGKGGTGAVAAPVHYDGGDGYTTPTRDGGGGGSAGGNAADGNDGYGRTGGAPLDGGGGGGPGGHADDPNPGVRGGGAGPSGTAGGGGGGGGLNVGGTQYGGGPGRSGLVRLTWSATAGAPLKTAVIHLPPRQLTAPAPLIAVGGGADVPNGATSYTAPATGSIPGRYQGTYQAILCMGTWNTPTVARTITVTIFQRLASGASLSTQLVKTLTPNTDPDLLRPLGGLVSMGTVPLPLAAISPGNKTDYFQVTVNDTNASDRALDLLLLDVTGQTAIYSTAGTGVAGLWLTEPDIGADFGTAYGSAGDWDTASSVMADMPVLSGGPLSVLPGENPILVYAVQGQPGLIASYTPRWRLDRLT